jgi:hypothetical protein
MTAFSDVAAQFASALVQGDYALAHSLLAESLKSYLTSQQIQESFENMVAQKSNLTTEVVETLTDWQEKQPGDVGWAYVAINGDNFAEAVTLTLCDDHNKTLIRYIVWGRP